MKPIAHAAPILAILAILITAYPSRAQVAGAPPNIDFQSQVLDSNGNPLAPTTPENFKMEFRIYDQQTGGTIIYSESQIVTVSNGVFSVRIGTGVPILGDGGQPEGSTTDLGQAFAGTQRFLGLTVEIPGQTPEEITPRMKFLSAPYSLVANEASHADSATEAEVAKSVFQPAGTSSTLRNVTIIGPTTLQNTSLHGSDQIQFGVGTADLAGSIRHGVNGLELLGSSNQPGDPRKVTLRGNEVAVFGSMTVGGALTVGGKISGNGSGLTGVTADIGPNSVNLEALVQAVQNALCPVGTVVAYSGDVAPPGWLLCDGRALTGTGTWKPLYDVIGTRFGNGDGSAARFRVPDLRGRFIRGFDGNAGRDPDRNSRYHDDEGSSGNRIGSLQDDEFKSHRHQFYDTYHVDDESLATSDLVSFFGVPGGQGSGVTRFEIGHTGWMLDKLTGFTGGTETRPENMYLNYIIKY